MIRTTIANAYIKRPLRELYSHSASTPADVLLDPAWNRAVDIFPGMVMMRKASAASGASDLVTLIDATGIPFGLCGVYIAPVFGVDEVALAGVNSIPVWVLSPGSEFEVQAPSFDSSLAYTFPTDGTSLLLGAYTSTAKQGVLCPFGTGSSTTRPVARAVSRPATDRLIISGLQVGSVGTYP